MGPWASTQLHSLLVDSETIRQIAFLSLDCIIPPYLGSNYNPLTVMNKQLVLTLSRFFS